MILVKSSSSLLLITVLIGKAIAQGNMFLETGNGKGQELKSAEKRVDNFRVPVDMPFDPNFWPARGRRGGGGTSERSFDYENWISPEENFLNDHRNNYRCTTNVLGNEDDYNSGFLDRLPEDCYDLPRRPGQSRSLKVCKTKLRRNPDGNEVIWLLTNKTEGKRHKQQRYQDIQSLFNNGYILMRPDSSNREKEKKQDVFWVARGKKTSK